MPYLISYFAVGVFWASATVLHSTSRDNALIVFAITVVFWPLVALVAPESFLRSDRTGADLPSDRVGTNSNPFPQDLVKKQLITLTQAEYPDLTEKERQRLSKVAKYGETQISFFGNEADFVDILFTYWNTNIPPDIYYSFKRALLELDERYAPESHPLFSLQAPDWYIGFSNEFVKSIRKADRKKQGRILEAIGKISVAPIEVSGDTIKPLTGNLAGLWRCRLGDDRLIYYPDTESKKVVLISFASRGEVYEEMPDVSSLTTL